MAVVKVKSGEATVERMEQELKHMIDAKWQWKVRWIADKEYLATFPNKQILDAFSSCNGFDMVLYNISVTISPSTRDPETS